MFRVFFCFFFCFFFGGGDYGFTGQLAATVGKIVLMVFRSILWDENVYKAIVTLVINVYGVVVRDILEWNIYDRIGDGAISLK